MQRKTLIAIVAILALVLAACGGSTVTITEADDGGSVTLSEGDTLEVKLAGNPTTGFNWSVTSVDSSVLEQEGDAEFDQDEELAGSPGVVTLTFKAKAAGSTDLVLEYAPVAGGDAERNFTSSVTVGS